MLGTFNVAQAALSHDVARLVHTSTSEVYGSAQTVPISEDHPLEAQSPYAASKIGADKLVESFHRSFGLPAVIRAAVQHLRTVPVRAGDRAHDRVAGARRRAGPSSGRCTPAAT